MRRLPLLGLLVLLVACVEGEVSAPPIVTDPQRSTTWASAITSTTSTTSTLPDANSTTPVYEGPVKALITPSGVVVMVTSRTSNGFVVTTPCGAASFVASGEELRHVQVVLDPGHGGPIDTGAVGPNGLEEKEVNLRLAETVSGLLEERGISTILTRSGDYATPLSVRAALADALDADLLVSIHHNAPTPGESAMPGTEIFIQSDEPESARLGGLIYEHAIEALSVASTVVWHAAPDAGVLEVHNPSGTDTYGMIRLPDTISVLTELAYISSLSEAKFLASDFYIDLVGPALADAIESFLTTDAQGSGLVPEPRVFTAQPSVGADVCEEVALG